MKFPSLEEGPPKVRDAGGEGLCHTSGERGATQEHWGEGILGEPLGPAHSSDNDSQRAAPRRPALRMRAAHWGLRSVQAVLAPRLHVPVGTCRARLGR